MNDIINEKLGAWLLVNGNTRSKLAEEIGISRPTLNTRLAGKSNWEWEEVIRIAKTVGCTLNDLAGISDSQPPSPQPT